MEFLLEVLPPKAANPSECLVKGNSPQRSSSPAVVPGSHGLQMAVASFRWLRMNWRQSNASKASALVDNASYRLTLPATRTKSTPLTSCLRRVQRILATLVKFLPSNPLPRCSSQKLMQNRLSLSSSMLWKIPNLKRSRSQNRKTITTMETAITTAETLPVEMTIRRVVPTIKEKALPSSENNA